MTNKNLIFNFITPILIFVHYSYLKADDDYYLSN